MDTIPRADVILAVAFSQLPTLLQTVALQQVRENDSFLNHTWGWTVLGDQHFVFRWFTPDIGIAPMRRWISVTIWRGEVKEIRKESASLSVWSVFDQVFRHWRVRLYQRDARYLVIRHLRSEWTLTRDDLCAMLYLKRKRRQRVFQVLQRIIPINELIPTVWKYVK